MGRLDGDKKSYENIVTSGGTHNHKIIIEFGLYNLIVHSQIPGAKMFKRWVNHGVLSAIR